MPMPAMAPPPGMPHSLLRRSELSVPAPHIPSITAEPDASAAPLERSQWERIALGADVELHIRRPLTRTQQKGIDRLVTIARELLEEERT